MKERNPDVLVITAKHEEDVAAERADLRVTVQGSSLVTGRAALEKAKEVRQLVDELVRCGLGESDIGLEGVHAQVSSGFLGKTSSATYRLRIRCIHLELLPDVLGAITSAKNARLDAVAWSFPNSADQQAKWLAASIDQANLKARAAAASLGTRIVGIHRMIEEPMDLQATASPYQSSYLDEEMGAVRRRAAPIDLGFDLAPQKRVGLKVIVEYRVEGYESPS
jgi:uncharacterized protein YggE